MKKLILLLLLISSSAFSQIIFEEGFENTTGPDAIPSTNWSMASGNWAVFDNIGVSSTVRWGITSFVAVPPRVNQGVNAAQILPENTGAGTISEEFLVTPLIDLTTVNPTDNIQLKFFTRSFFQGNQGTLYQIKVAPAATPSNQTSLGQYTVLQTWTEDQLTSVHNIYEEKVVDLSAYIGTSVYLAFVKINVQETGQIDGDCWLIDDVRVVFECPVPFGANASNVSLSSATLNWVTPAPNASSEVFIVNNGQIPVGQFPVGNGTSVTGTLAGTNYNYNFIANQTTAGVALQPNTTYQYYIRTVCSTSNKSQWVAFDFTTQSLGLSCTSPISITTLPYSTNDNTANYADNTDTPQPSACAGTATNFMTGNDVFYSYTPATSGTISITMTPNANASGIFVYQGCANVGVNCLAGVANTGNGVRSIPSLTVTAGQTYIIVLSSNAAQQTYGYSFVIQQLNCAQPDNLNAPFIGQTTAVLSWGNPGGATSWEVLVQPVGGPVLPGAGITTTNNTTYLVPGPLTQNTLYQYWVRADCGNGTFSDWAGPYLFRTLCDAFPVPFQEVFNSNSTTQACWTVLNVNADTDQWNMDSTLAPFEGNQSAEINTDFNNGNNNDWLISPQIILTGNQRLKFHYRVQSDFEPNDFRVMLSTTGTAPASFTNTLIPLTSYDNEVYRQAIVNLSAYTGPVNIAWHVPNGGLDGWRIFIDNVIIENIPSCLEPTALSASSVQITSATISWTNGNTETAWEYLVVPCGSPAPTAATPATGAISPGTGNLTGLSGSTCYDVYIRAVCSATDSSPWSNPISITTQVVPPACGGVFTDPGGPTGNYSDSNDSTVTICPVNPGDQVTVTFTSFNTEINWDGLYVYNGNSIASPQISSGNGPTNIVGSLPGSFWGNLTGANLPGPFSSEMDGCLTFRFISDAVVTNPGWVASVVCAPPPTCTRPTNVLATNPTSSGATINWTQLPNPDTSVATEWQILALPCGSPPPIGTSTGFVTVSNVTNYVFNTLNPTTCYVVYVRAVCSLTDVSFWSTIATFTTLIAPPACGGVFTDPGGPSANYSNSTDSTVTICPENPGELVTVTFTSFNTQAIWDGLYVFKGNSIAAPQIASANDAGNVPGGLAGAFWGNLTGANLPGPFSSDVDGCLTFRFRSDSVVTNPGWVASVNCGVPRIRAVSFIDTNNNGIQEPNEPIFNYGNFVYQVNDSGINISGSGNNGAYVIFDSIPTNSYDIHFDVNPNLTNNYACTTSYTDITSSQNTITTLYFPVTVIQNFIDCSINLINSVPPRPGFQYTIPIVYSNVGHQSISNGTLTFTKDPNVTITNILPFGAVMTPTGFTYNFTNLAPNQSQYIYVILQVPTIPTVALGQLLNYSASVQVAGDVTASNNTSFLTQTIVGSYDPNDKFESHGGKIMFDNFTNDDYLYYTIRFENTGTANAEFVRIEDTLNSQLEPNSFELIAASHEVNARRNGNQLTFFFYDIDLPPTQNDPIASQGFVHFKIKPKPGFALGDIIPNGAEIYFDFNPAIITNLFETEFVETLSTTRFEANEIALFPNPSTNDVTIQLLNNQNIKQVQFFDVSGKMIQSIENISNWQTTIDISHFEKGLYFVEITTTTAAKQTKKLIKQ
jgi:uncharacterized repeat protein (TIGR01451 family)